MSTLYLCEKPAQARDIARVLGAHERKEGYIQNAQKQLIVTWCIGHLLELASPEYYRQDLKPWRKEVLPIVPKEWVLVPNEKTKTQLNIIKKLIKTTKTVVIACDPDREGESISREVLDYCQYHGNIQRLWLSSLDDASIKKSLVDLKPNAFSAGLYQAAIGRQRADWLIGMNMTMAATLAATQKQSGVLSVGRVQTPTLKLVVDRDLAIEQFVPQDYFVVKAQFSDGLQSFWTTWQVPDVSADEAGRCTQVQVAETLIKQLQNKVGVVQAFDEKERTHEPPLCLSLSALQKLASSRWGLSAKETLDIAQSLYEKHKATTYPRTDCGYLPESQRAEAPLVLKALVHIDHSLRVLIDACDLNYTSPVWNDKKITAHHGIIPTLSTHVDWAEMGVQERKIYDLIRRYYIAQFLKAYRYYQRTVTVHCAEALFSAQSHTPHQLGWKQAFGQENITEEDEVEEELSPIPALQHQSTINCVQATMERKKTKPLSRYTDGTLIAAMKSIAKTIADPTLKKVLNESLGIGTEATRATIIDTLFKRNYVEKKGKLIQSTPKGRALIAQLPEIIKDPAMTALWEQSLTDIAQQKQSLDAFVQAQTELVKSAVKALILS